MGAGALKTTDTVEDSEVFVEDVVVLVVVGMPLVKVMSALRDVVNILVDSDTEHEFEIFLFFLAGQPPFAAFVAAAQTVQLECF